MNNICFYVEKVALFSNSLVGLGESCTGTLAIKTNAKDDYDDIHPCLELADMLEADFKYGFIVYKSNSDYIKSSEIKGIRFSDDAAYVTTRTSIYKICKAAEV